MSTNDTDSDRSEAELQQNGAANKSCVIEDCPGGGDVKAVRDPSGEVVEMCAWHRSEWPVEVLE